MFVLRYEDTQGVEQSVALRDGLEVTVGRSAGSTIRIKANSVSRRHARIFQHDDTWMVEDLGSANHCFINGEKIERANISAGDHLRFGKFKVRVMASLDSDAAPVEDDVEVELDAPLGGKDKTPSMKRARPQRPGAASEVAQAEPSPSSSEEASQEDQDRASLLKARREADNNKKAAIEARRQLAASKAVDQGFQQALRDAESLAGSLELELQRNRDKVEELEQAVKELEARDSRHEEELDGWHDRFSRVRDQLDHQVDLLEQTRDALKGKENQLEEFESKMVQLEADNVRLEHQGQEQSELLNELKSRVVQKERRVEELQRELDLMEYDLREAREELESVVDTRNADSSDQRRLEREIEMLREVNAEKEGLITELKFIIEGKEREVYELKSGSGIQDLEEARREVLEQYFEKNREVDNLQDTLKQQQAEVAVAQEQVAELEAKLSERRDVTKSPEYARKEREMERLQQDLTEAHEGQRRLEAKLQTFGPEARGKLEAEVNFLQRKNRALQDKLEAANASTVSKAVSATAPTTPNMVPTLAEDEVDVLLNAHSQWAVHLDTLRTALTAYADSLAGDNSSAEAVSELSSLVGTLEAEASRTRKELGRLKGDTPDA